MTDQGSENCLDPGSCPDDRGLGVWKEGKHPFPELTPLARGGGQERQGGHGGSPHQGDSNAFTMLHCRDWQLQSKNVIVMVQIVPGNIAV